MFHQNNIFAVLFFKVSAWISNHTVFKRGLTMNTYFPYLCTVAINAVKIAKYLLNQCTFLFYICISVQYGQFLEKTMFFFIAKIWTFIAPASVGGSMMGAWRETFPTSSLQYSKLMYFQLGENINIPNTKVSINDVALRVCIEQRLYNSDAQNVLCGFFFHYFMYCTVYYVKHYSTVVVFSRQFTIFLQWMWIFLYSYPNMYKYRSLPNTYKNDEVDL